jgi:hypothetical protein
MMLRLNPAQLFLSVICAALAVVLGYMMFAPLPQVAPARVEAAAPPTEDAPLERFEAPPRQKFADVDNRSVFNPLRVRVSAPFRPGATNATSLPADLSLVGIILDKDTKLALFRSSAAPLAVGVPVGGSVEGWQVTRIEPDSVGLRAGGPEQNMDLSANKPSVPQGTGPNMSRPFGPPNFPRPPNFIRNNPNANRNVNGSNNNNNDNNDNDDDDDDK